MPHPYPHPHPHHHPTTISPHPHPHLPHYSLFIQVGLRTPHLSCTHLPCWFRRTHLPPYMPHTLTRLPPPAHLPFSRPSLLPTSPATFCFITYFVFPTTTTVLPVPAPHAYTHHATYTPRSWLGRISGWGSVANLPAIYPLPAAAYAQVVNNFAGSFHTCCASSVRLRG